MRVALAAITAVAVLIVGGVLAWRLLDLGDDTVVHIEAAAGGTARNNDGVAVTFAPAALTADTDVRIRPLKDVPAPAGTVWLSDPVDVTLTGGELRTAATLTMPVKVSASADDTSVTIVSRDAEGVWTAEGGTVDPVAGAVTTIVGHFSAKGALKRLNDITEVPRKVGSTLVSAFKDAAYDAPAPKCDPGSRLWTSRTNGNNVKVCVKGGTDDQPSSRLRVVNNRLYGQFLQLQAYPKLIVDQQAKADPVTNIWRA